MNRRRFVFSLPLLLFHFLQFHTLPFILGFTLPFSNNSYVLEDVLKGISERQNWDFEEIMISKLEVSRVRYGFGQRYEFRIRFGKTYLVFKFPDEVRSWNKFNKQGNEFADFVKEVASTAQLDTFQIEGPFDLRVGGQDELSLSLPLNASHSGLKRILVGEGIAVEIKGARELSLFHTFDQNSMVNESFMTSKGKTGFCPFWKSFCMPLVPINVNGSASLIAYMTGNSEAPIETTLLSEETIELLPAKCYSNNAYRNHAQLNPSLSLKIDRLGKLLRSFLSSTKKKSSGFLRTSLKASSVFRFHLELEKSTESNATLDGSSEDWRTKPTVERFWFEIMARVEAEKLRLIMAKRLKPLVAVDTISWSNLMSNISFTKFPSILVPPEALTLDVKW